MPYPDLSTRNVHFFSYNGVDVYIERRDQHPQEPLLEFWYSTSQSTGTSKRFDVRSLTGPNGAVSLEDIEKGNVTAEDLNNKASRKKTNESGVTHYESKGRKAHKEIIKKAIDKGEVPL